jgi:hypothetical protein
MVVRLLRVLKSLRPQRCSLSTTVFTPTPSCIFRGQVPRTFYLFATFPLHSAGPTCSHSILYCLFVEMFSKSFIAPIFLLALTSSVNAHAAIAPALGVKGNPARSDVQRPSQAKPCGTINIAQNLDTSSPVNALANGTFSASITDFNP